MSKITLSTLANLSNESTAVASLNANFAAIQAEIDLLLSRDGSSPNTMVALLDMNDYSVINLPVPTTDTEPARHGDIQTYVDDAAASATAALASENAAELAETNAETAQANIDSRYLGNYSTAPTVDPSGNAVIEGAMYYDDTIEALRVYQEKNVLVTDLNQVIVSAGDEVLVSGWVAIPVNTIRSMNDIAETWANDEVVVWNTGQGKFIPLVLNAAAVPFDNTVKGALSAATVQEAIDEVTDSITAGVYDISLFVEGLSAEGEIFYRLGAVRSFTVPSDTTGFIADSGTTANTTGQVVLKKNDVQFGTITWTSPSDTGVWSIPGDTSFAAGDILSIEAPAIVDTSLADLTISIIATR